MSRLSRAKTFHTPRINIMIPTYTMLSLNQKNDRANSIHRVIIGQSVSKYTVISKSYEFGGGITRMANVLVITFRANSNMKFGYKLRSKQMN